MYKSCVNCMHCVNFSYETCPCWILQEGTREETRLSLCLSLKAVWNVWTVCTLWNLCSLNALWGNRATFVSIYKRCVNCVHCVQCSYETFASWMLYETLGLPLRLSQKAVWTMCTECKIAMKLDLPKYSMKGPAFLHVYLSKLCELRAQCAL